MPVNVVKTPGDEKKWEKAKRIAASQGQARNWAYIMGVFKKMKGESTEKQAALRPIVVVVKRALEP